MDMIVSGWKPWTVDIGLIIHIESRPPQRGW